MSTPPVPLLDLKAQASAIRPELDAAIARVIDRQNFVLGPELEAFERAFAELAGCQHAVGVASGTDAVELALRAAGVTPGDEVITCAFTFIASVLGVERAGAKAVLVDCEPTTFGLDLDRVSAAITPKTKAIVPVHLYGQPVDTRPLEGLLRDRGIVVVEDAAQAHGAEVAGVRVGALGEAAAFSFYPGKNLGAYGDGGAVSTRSPEIAARLKALRNYGSPEKYHHPVWGTNSRLDEIQAAILSVKLPHLLEWNARRRAAAARYHEMLATLADRVVLPKTMPERTHAWHLYVVRVKDRDRVLTKLHERGIGAGIHYPIPVHLQGAMSHLGHRAGSFPEAERASKEVLSLPLFAEITEDQQARVVEELGRAL